LIRINSREFVPIVIRGSPAAEADCGYCTWAIHTICVRRVKFETSLQHHTLSRKDFLNVMVSGTAGVLSAAFGSPLSHRATVPTTTEPLIHGLTPYIRLYGATAEKIGDNAKLDDLKISVNCKDSSRIKWNVTAPEEGEYDLFISCAVPGPLLSPGS